MRKDNAIGVFDSGFGGLSLVKEICNQLPEEEIIYFADAARCPYGIRPLTEVRRFAFEIIEFLERRDAKAVVVACNTATAAGLEAARRRFSTPIIGVIGPGSEAAVKESKNDRIGVIATEGTVKSRAYERAIRSLRPSAEVFGKGCQIFVDLVEAGKTEGGEVEEIVVKCLEPLLKEDIDTLVLGCTHFHFLEDAIKRVVGGGVTIVNPAYKTVKHLKEILESNGLDRAKAGPTTYRYFTTGEIEVFREIGENLLGKPITNLEHVEVQELTHTRNLIF